MLTPQEIDAIAAYDGPVRKIPQGVSGLPPLVWSDKARQVVYADKATGDKMRRNTMTDRHYNAAAQKIEAAARRKQLVDLLLSGVPMKAAAQRMGVHYSTAKGYRAAAIRLGELDRCEFGIGGHKPVLQIAAAEMRKQGMSYRAIAEQLGVRPDSVKRALERARKRGLL